MKKKALQVSLNVREPSIIELTVGDKVQLDRLLPSHRGAIAERHGRPLDPGLARLSLESGQYFFKTLSDANLKVVHGGVEIATTNETKDPWPDPPLLVPASKGDDVAGDAPTLTVG